MKLIRRLVVEDFRSIQKLNFNLPDSGFLPIVGTNNSGKSNILRALSLFFNDETEPGQPINLYEDFHNPSRKKKKMVSVEVHFDLPDHFHIQKTILTAIDSLLGRKFVIRKTWSLPTEPTEEAIVQFHYRKTNAYTLNEASGDDVTKLKQFLALTRFRYIPNHIHPSKILQSEQSQIQRELLTRLRRSKNVGRDQVDTLFKELSALSKEFAMPITEKLRSAAPDIDSLNLSIPSNLGDLLFSFATQLKVREGETFNALLHGSGIQSLLTILILHYLDSRFSERFGWHQATIWAIEEPESYLHQDLMHRVASFLSEIVRKRDNRFQVFCTTHSNVFVRHAYYGILCQLKSGKTSSAVIGAHKLLSESSRLGISPYLHPLLYGEPKPLLLVEGLSDSILLQSAFETLRIACPWEIKAVEEVNTGKKFSGSSGLATYLELNRDILSTRSLKAPVVVLIDWNENSKTVNKIHNLLSAHPTSATIQWDARDANLDLDNTFTGIERYLSTKVILEAMEKGFMNIHRPIKNAFPLSVNKASVKKMELAHLVENRSNKDDFQFFKKLLKKLGKFLSTAQIKARQIEEGRLFLNSNL